MRVRERKMSRRPFSTRVVLAILLASTLYAAGCVDPKEIPGFRGAVREEEEKSTRETEEAIKGSPELQELARLCTEVVPVFEGFRLVYKSGAFKERPLYLSYKYYSEADYLKVKGFYKSYFEQRGWRLTEQKDGGWGQRWVEFRKGVYKVKVFHGMSEEVNYAIHCEKLSDSGVGTPR